MENPEPRRRIEAICDAALDVATADRDAFIAHACAGDDELRRSVNAMLAHAQKADEFLKTPVGALAARVFDDDLSGSSIGHYTVRSTLGRGGMGLVYRAHDIQLGRDVALKMLPETFQSDPDRVARFQREAKMLAAMNHPHIAQIHGLETVGSRQFLVLELVDGEALDHRIGRGPIPVDQSLQIAKQIADALEAAHEKGIIHRDLKPSNIALTAQEEVKVLDFGLAKAIEPDAAGGRGTVTIASSNADVAAKVMLGTPGYMAPEQTRGAGDRRSDIWAFGCVLYEMLTGRPAFVGDDLALTIAAVLSKAPNWETLPEATPVGLRRLLRQCLEKDPRHRLQAIGDARVLIEDLLSGQTDEGAPSAAPMLERAHAPSRLGWRLTGLAVVAGAIGVATWAMWGRQAETPAKITFDLVTPVTNTSNQVALSPDGARLAAVVGASNGFSLWLRRLDQVDDGQVVATMRSGPFMPFWSADSKSLAFFAEGKLSRIDLSGGPAQPVCEAPSGRGGTWNRDGILLFAPSANGPLFRVAAAGGVPRPVTQLDRARGDKAHLQPKFLPDGQHFIFLVQSVKDEHGALYLGSLDSNETTRLTRSDAMGVLATPDHLLFVRGGTLFAQQFDVRRHNLHGEPFPVADDVGFAPENGLASITTSDTGMLAYRTTGAADRVLRWVDRAGRPLGDVGAVGAHENPAVAPRGNRVAETRLQGAAGDLWTVDPVDGSSSQFTFDDHALDDNAVWSPDGQQIVFASSREGGVRNVYRKNASGAGREELLLKTERSKIPTDWSRDGEYLLYTEGPAPWQVWALPLKGTRTPIPYLRASFDESNARFSPDGRWVAYTSDEGDMFHVNVQRFPDGQGKWQVSVPGGPACHPRWRSDGKELFYTTGTAIWAVDVATTPTTFHMGVPRKLFDASVPYAGSADKVGFDVTPDGQRFLLIGSRTSPNNLNRPIRIVLNWAVRSAL